VGDKIFGNGRLRLAWFGSFHLIKTVAVFRPVGWVLVALQGHYEPQAVAARCTHGTKPRRPPDGWLQSVCIRTTKLMFVTKKGSSPAERRQSRLQDPPYVGMCCAAVVGGVGHVTIGCGERGRWKIAHLSTTLSRWLDLAQWADFSC